MKNFEGKVENILKILRRFGGEFGDNMRQRTEQVWEKLERRVREIREKCVWMMVTFTAALLADWCAQNRIIFWLRRLKKILTELSPNFALPYLHDSWKVAVKGAKIGGGGRFDILKVKMHLCIKFTTYNYVFRLDFILFLVIEVKTKVRIKNILFLQSPFIWDWILFFYGHAGDDNCSMFIPHKLMLTLTRISRPKLKWLSEWLIDRGSEWLSN